MKRQLVFTIKNFQKFLNIVFANYTKLIEFRYF